MSTPTPGTTSLAYRRADVEAILRGVIKAGEGHMIVSGKIIDQATKLLAEITPKAPLILTLPSGRKRLLCPWCGHDGRTRVMGKSRHRYTEEIGSTRDISGFDDTGVLFIDGESDEDGSDSVEERVMCGACSAEFALPDDEREWDHLRDEETGDDEEPAPHTKDADCAGFLLPDNTCAVCRVEHIGACDACGAAAYHVGACPEIG